jgi:replicative DNA helicase Mcm
MDDIDKLAKELDEEKDDDFSESSDTPKMISENPEVKQSNKEIEELLLDAKNFINSYKNKLGESLRQENSIAIIDFEELTTFSPVLSEELIINPETTLRILEQAIEEIGLESNVRVRLTHLQESHLTYIRNLRAKHLDTMILVEGIVRQASDVRPQVVNAKFECPSCGTIISVLQLEKKFREPTRCSCGRRGGFKIISKEMVDTQRLIIEESPESLSGGEQPKRINVFVKEDLVEPKMEKKTTPGSKVRVIGVLKEVPVPLSTGGMSTRFELAVETNNLIPLEETFDEIKIDEEDERQILELSQDPEVFEKLSASIAPSIWGIKK